MATPKFIESAKKPIYKYGKKVEYVSKRGKHAGQVLSKIDRSIPRDSEDEILIDVGESYWTWTFYGGQPNYSKTKPKRSQLTLNWFKSQLYDIQERIEDLSANEPEELQVLIDDVISELEELRDECQERYDNIPEQLQESSEEGEILQNRIEGLESAISEFESLDLDFNLDEDFDTLSETEIEQIIQERESEWIDEKINDIADIDLEIE